MADETSPWFARLKQALSGSTRPATAAEQESYLQGGSPIDALKSRLEAENARVYSPDEVYGNIGDTLFGALAVTPGPGNINSLEDAFRYGGKTVDKAREGDTHGARKNMLVTELSALGAIPFLPLGGTAGAASRTNIFAGPMAKTADHAALENAKRLAQSGATRDEIWNQTGWFAGKDGKWRFEIPDNASADISPMGLGIPSFSSKAQNVLHHPDYYKAYPEAADMKVQFLRDRPEGLPHGAYYAGEGYYARGAGKEDRRSIALHEMQHDAQYREGFAPGGSWKDMLETPELKSAVSERFQQIKAQGADLSDADILANAQSEVARNLYRNLAGEVEARNAQTRMDMTPAERRAKAPWLTQDVPDEQQIVRRK